MKKRMALAAAVMIVLLPFWLVHLRNQSRRARAQRDAAYEERLDRFQHDLGLRMHRAEVKSYLDSNKISFSQINSNFDVKIGQDPAGEWYCDHWYVYVEFRFSYLAGQTQPSPFDNLDGISIRKIGSCL
jgi:hypothetical protein